MNEVAPATRSRRRRGLAWLASFLGLVLLAEIACRIDAFFPSQPFDSGRARAYLELRQTAGADQTLAMYTAPDPTGEESSVRPVPHPFLGWTSARDVRVLEAQGRWFGSPESRESFDVFVMGGSVAAEFGNLMGPRLADRLGADPHLRGRTVRVWNNAHAGHKAPQTTNLLSWLWMLGHAPDAIVLVDGFNEVAVSATNARNGVHPDMPSNEFWSPLARGKFVDASTLDRLVELHQAQRAEQGVARTAVELGFWRSALLTRVTLARLASKHRAFSAAVEHYLAAMQPQADDPTLRGPEFDADLGAVAAAAARAWSENARTFAWLCRAHGVPLVHVLQPTLYDRDTKPMTAEEARFTTGSSAWKDGVTAGYPRLRSALKELAAEDVPVTDGTRLFAETRAATYVDVCHLNEAGYALLCDRVVAEFARVLR